MSISPIDVCKTLFSAIPGDESDLVAMIVVSQVLKNRKIHADILQRTIYVKDSSFCIYMLLIEDHLVGLDGVTQWDVAGALAASKRGITDFIPSNSVGGPFLFTSLTPQTRERIAELAPRLEAAAQRIELNENTTHGLAESRSGLRL